MRTVDKSMVHINGKRKYQTAFTRYGLAGSHQRITATVACFGKCIGYRGEIHFGNRTQMDHIVIALLGKNLFGSIRVTVLGHVCYQGSDDLEDKLAEKGKNAKSVEGKATGWILLDYGTVIVHVFTKESRENFNLEKLWGDAEEVDVSEWISE